MTTSRDAIGCLDIVMAIGALIAMLGLAVLGFLGLESGQ